MSLGCDPCGFALLEWLIHTPTASTLVDLRLSLSYSSPTHQNRTRPDRKLDDYIQVFAPSIRWAEFGRMSTRAPRDEISLSGFSKLESLDLEATDGEWSRVADMLRALPARLHTLVFLPAAWDPSSRESDRLIEEDGEFKAMRTNDLELLDPVLSRDNFKGLRRLTFKLDGYRDVLDPLRETILETIQLKLPTLHSRGCLDLQLNCYERVTLPAVAERKESGQAAV
ncbi:hypothetical protein GSI_12786 [Ganoderma sinense ZZ0214-1]|uniref:Uncharacterized protein n=1 Tax=Ganoderma sinense ZZ0214-1 TaxID=1077348 RepID=A0A2G8RTS2_9APHY|nr:hypothetical protein GSI_12786 [Ganoderma sinense ZZ0214-1]